MDLSIIIVNWNSVTYLRNCLESIYSKKHNFQFEVVVIDAASFDGSGEMLSECFPQVRFIQAKDNLGFAKANNMAFKESSGEVVLFLNPDTEIVGDAIAAMIAALRRLSDAGSLGCKLLNTNGSIQTSCIQSVPTILNQCLDSEFLRSRWPNSSLWGMSPLHSGGEMPSVVEAISGACVMMSRKLFSEVGMFSEDYFMYAEDIDLSDKVSKAGFKNYYVPCASVIHHGGASSATATNHFSTVMMRESIWRFLRKTRGLAYGLAYRMAMSIVAVARLLLLTFLFPVQRVRSRGTDWKASFGKWCAILRWSIYPQLWVRKKH